MYCADELERVILSLAIIYIIGNIKKRHEWQALLDQDLQINIIKAFLAKHLKLFNLICRVFISDIGADASDPIHGRVHVELASRYIDEFRTILSLLSMDKMAT